VRRFLARLIAGVRHGRADAELARELASHRALLEDDFLRRGLAPEEARAAAERALGSRARARDLHRDARSFAWLDDLRRDLHYALRTLRRAPGFTIVVVLTLALGIGANTAIFSVVHSVLIRPLPYRDSARLVRVWENVPGAEIGNGKGPNRRYAAMDVADLLAVSERSRAIASLAAFSLARATITIDGDATRMDGFGVSAGFFQMLGVAPLIGRTFAPEEAIAGRDRVLVLAYDAWQRFGGDARVLGRTVAFTGNSLGVFSGGIVPEAPYTIVGVMPSGFHFPYDNAQFWIPRAATRSIATCARSSETPGRSFAKTS